MNSVTQNALPSRLIIAAGLAVVGAGVVTYVLHSSAPKAPTALVAPAPAPPPPPVAQIPTPPAAATPAPEAAVTPPPVVQQDSASAKADATASATPSEPKVASSRHTAKAHSSTRNSDDTGVAAAPVTPVAPPPDSAANATAANSAAPNSSGDAAAPAATANNVQASNAQEGPASADTAGADSKITTEVKSRLAADNVTKDANIGVTTTQGVVVLTGTLASQDAVDHVKQVTQNIQDVKSVDTSALKVTGTS